MLSALVLIGWQYFFGMPQMEKQRQEQQQQQQAADRAADAGAAAQPTPPAPAQPGAPGARRRCPARRQRRGRRADDRAKRRSRPRRASPIDDASVQGSIALKGGRIDDLALVKYRETVDPNSPPIVLLSPSGSRRSVLCRVRLDRRRRRQR